MNVLRMAQSTKNVMTKDNVTVEKDMEVCNVKTS